MRYGYGRAAWANSTGHCRGQGARANFAAQLTPPSASAGPSSAGPAEAGGRKLISCFAPELRRASHPVIVFSCTREVGASARPAFGSVAQQSLGAGRRPRQASCAGKRLETPAVAWSLEALPRRGWIWPPVSCADRTGRSVDASIPSSTRKGLPWLAASSGANAVRPPHAVASTLAARRRPGRPWPSASDAAPLTAKAVASSTSARGRRRDWLLRSRTLRPPSRAVQFVETAASSSILQVRRR